MSELPSGTVTFLFTDLEGSTALLRQLQDRYGEVLVEQHRLLRSAAEEAGGREIDTQGDSSFIVFRNPREAVRGAVAGQLALSAHSWPAEVKLRVRMGIHTGEASVVADRYVGLAVHRAARICAAGHGGQILLSEATQMLLEDREEDLGVTLRDLGALQLKDFERPVRVFQLVGRGLPDAFPPPRTSEPDGPVRGLKLLAGATVRVVVADDQALVRTGFRMILEAEDDMDVVGEAQNGLEAMAEVRRCRPDVVLMDVRMPELDGIEATRRLVGDDGVETRVVMLTTFDMDEYVYEALRAGASGFLLKDVPPEQLVAGIRAVASGDALLAPSVTRRVIEEFVRRPPDSIRKPPPELDELTNRELEVLKLVARGLSNAEIATQLYISDTTVKTHVARILMKLRLRDRVQAVVFAYESGLLHPGTT
jgi:DNA-binding NarL/FixJ family response regulator/class 3 adenylate cyclase